MKALRVRILESLCAELEKRLGVGQAGRPIRALRRGVWAPDLMPVPALTVMDAGRKVDQQQDGDGETQASFSMQSVLSVSGILELTAQWDRDGGADAWAETVESMDSIIQAWSATGRARELGVISARVVSDEPVELVLTGGESRSAWVLDIEIEFAAEIAA